MTAPTPPKSTASSRSTGAATADRFNGTTAAALTGVHAALHAVEQLKNSVDQLEQELKTYSDTNVIGRDTVLLQSFFSQIYGRTMQVAQACKIQWSPTSNASGRR